LLNNLPNTTTTVTIPAEYIEPGTLTIKLTVKDSYLQQSTTTVYIEKIEDHQIPIVMIEGPVHRQVKRRHAFFIDSHASFSPCASTTDKRLKFSWTSDPSLNLESQKSSRLFIPPYVLESGIQYKFTLNVSVINNEEAIASSTIDAFVEVESSNLIAKISGGTSRTVPAISTLVIDASSSFDPDDPQANLNYQWKC